MRMLQIYFQSGTFEAGKSSFWTELLISALGALIGILGAFAIYLVSIKQIRTDRLRYVASLLNSIIPSMTNQARYCSEYAALIRNDPF